MTDHDRGAYTPQPDAPLQFDARGPRGRKPMPMTLIGSGAVLVVLLGALALHYRHDSKGAVESARPVGTPVAQMKTAAPATAQPKPDASGTVDVFGGGVARNEAQTGGKSPTFAPAPEAPKPRAQLHVQADDGVVVRSSPMSTTNTTAVASTPVKPATLTTATVAKAPPVYHAPTPASVAGAGKPDATAIVAKLAAGAPAKPAVASATVKPTATTLASAKTPTAATTTPKTSAGGSVVQIGAFSSAELSTKGFSDVSSAMSGAMAGKAKRVEAVEKDGKTFYRTSVTGFSSRAAAEAFCKTLAAKGHVCFAKG
jgi:hypothetical protein